MYRRIVYTKNVIGINMNAYESLKRFAEDCDFVLLYDDDFLELYDQAGVIVFDGKDFLLNDDYTGAFRIIYSRLTQFAMKHPEILDRRTKRSNFGFEYNFEELVNIKSELEILNEFDKDI